MSDFLEPWVGVSADQRPELESELARELSSGHSLAGLQVRAVARRSDNDDVLFEVAVLGYAVVHLTWRDPEQSAEWPSTEFFSSLEEWFERRMRPDHEDAGG